MHYNDVLPPTRPECMRGARLGMTMHHIERLFVYPITDLFALIADIESYPLYMPGWRAVRISERSLQRLEVEQLVSLFGLSIDFRSVAEFDPPHQLRISATQFPFRMFRLCWQLRSLCPTSTLVQADFDLSFRTAALDRLADKMAPRMLERTVSAFAEHARRTITS
jgi:coenzyme Q-binding protein COQ10